MPNADRAAEHATKRMVLVDAVVRAEFPHAGRWIRWDTTEERAEKMAKALEEACQDFLAHCKDHRSLDVIDLSVERVYQAQCSACGREWETDRREDGVEQCASCGVEVPHE